MEDEARFFKVFSYPLRLRLAVLLAHEDEICVCRLAEAMDEPEYKISRHLCILRDSGVVETRRDGTWIYYSLAEPANHMEKCVIECFRKHLAGHPSVIKDIQRLKRTSCNQCDDDKEDE